MTVLIAEGDPMVAELERSRVQKDRRVESCKVQLDPQKIWETLECAAPELLILELRLSGLELLRRLRGAGLRTDVVAVTAQRDCDSLNEALRLGVVDYVLKPFSWARFDLAMERVFFKRELLCRVGSEAVQPYADRLFSFCSTEFSRRPAVKGIQDATLAVIWDFFRQNSDGCFSCSQVAAGTGLSRVTVDRYLHYMEENLLLTGQIDYRTNGRPRVTYALTAPPLK